MLVELAVTPIVLGLTDVDVRVPFPVDADPALTAVVVVALTEVEVETRNKYRFYLVVWFLVSPVMNCWSLLDEVL